MKRKNILIGGICLMIAVYFLFSMIPSLALTDIIHSSQINKDKTNPYDISLTNEEYSSNPITAGNKENKTKDIERKFKLSDVKVIHSFIGANCYFEREFTDYVSIGGKKLVYDTFKTKEIEKMKYSFKECKWMITDHKVTQDKSYETAVKM